jgi:hypothetical protein
MHVIDEQMPFNNPTLFPSRQVMKEGTKLLTQRWKEFFLAIFGNPHKMVLALPRCVQ